MEGSSKTRLIAGNILGYGHVGFLGMDYLSSAYRPYVVYVDTYQPNIIMTTIFHSICNV